MEKLKSLWSLDQKEKMSNPHVVTRFSVRGRLTDTNEPPSDIRAERSGQPEHLQKLSAMAGNVLTESKEQKEDKLEFMRLLNKKCETLKTVAKDCQEMYKTLKIIKDFEERENNLLDDMIANKKAEKLEDIEMQVKEMKKENLSSYKSLYKKLEERSQINKDWRDLKELIDSF